MIGIIAHYDHKKGAGVVELRYKYQRFDYVARAFDTRMVFVATDGSIGLLSPPEVVCASLEEALALFEGHEPVYLHRDAGEAVMNVHYDWPAKPVLVVGPDYGDMRVPDGARCAFVSYRDMVMELWADQALAIALHCYANRVRA